MKQRQRARWARQDRARELIEQGVTANEVVTTIAAEYGLTIGGARRVVEPLVKVAGRRAVRSVAAAEAVAS